MPMPTPIGLVFTIIKHNRNHNSPNEQTPPLPINQPPHHVLQVCCRYFRNQSCYQIVFERNRRHRCRTLERPERVRWINSRHGQCGGVLSDVQLESVTLQLQRATVQLHAAGRQRECMNGNGRELRACAPSFRNLTTPPPKKKTPNPTCMLRPT